MRKDFVIVNLLAVVIIVAVLVSIVVSPSKVEPNNDHVVVNPLAAHYADDSAPDLVVTPNNYPAFHTGSVVVILYRVAVAVYIISATAQ